MYVHNDLSVPLLFGHMYTCVLSMCTQAITSLLSNTTTVAGRKTHAFCDAWI